MAINLADLISLAEYAREHGESPRTIRARAHSGTLRHEGKDACWFKGGQWWVYRHAEHWPKKRGRSRVNARS